LRYLWLGAPLLQQLRLWQAQRDRKAQRARREIRAKTPLGVRRKKDALRKQDEPKIRELRTRELETAMIRVARAASTFLQLPMEERAAPGTEELT
jgi:hypothetical protein